MILLTVAYMDSCCPLLARFASDSTWCFLLFVKQGGSFSRETSVPGNTSFSSSLLALDRSHSDSAWKVLKPKLTLICWTHSRKRTASDALHGFASGSSTSPWTEELEYLGLACPDTWRPKSLPFLAVLLRKYRLCLFHKCVAAMNGARRRLHWRLAPN